MDYKYLMVDLFAGAGGVSSGAARAEFLGDKVVKVIVAVNHDPKAIESHEMNHPDTTHFVEDVRDMDFDRLAKIVNLEREKHPNAKVVLWISAECTHHSIAKGGPKDEGSRSLPFIVPDYQRAINPDYIFAENVKEFLDWGPCDINGYPIKELKGETYNEWVNLVSSLGYNYQYTIDNAADFGAYTSRIRYFGAFIRPNLHFAFPKQTHSKRAENGLEKWLKVRDVLDLDLHGNSIFEKRKSDQTYRRILEGCKRHIGREFMIQYNGTSHCQSIEKPCGTLTTKDRFATVSLQFMDKQYGTGVPQSIDLPSASLTTVPKLRLVTAQFMDQQYGKSIPKSIDEPVNTITATPKQSLVTAQFLDNPQWGGNTWSVDRPCFTLIARMDKAPPALVSAVRYGSVVFTPKDGDNERMLKQFMIDNGIFDIRMRMLLVEEMLEIMGFGRDYKLAGGVTDKKRFIGNAVVCDYVQRWFEAMAEVAAKGKFYQMSIFDVIGEAV